jgi:GTPase SAR1 family protein
MTIFGQLIIGAPGSGKTTYCDGMLQIFRGIQRPCVCVNLDPANDNLPFNPDIDICELVTVGDVMDKLNLGPNGALLYCIQTLANNLSWFELNEYYFFLGIMYLNKIKASETTKRMRGKLRPDRHAWPTRIGIF